jgi:hypothetical protein
VWGVKKMSGMFGNVKIHPGNEETFDDNRFLDANLAGTGDLTVFNINLMYLI